MAPPILSFDADGMKIAYALLSLELKPDSRYKQMLAAIIQQLKRLRTRGGRWVELFAEVLEQNRICKQIPTDQLPIKSRTKCLLTAYIVVCRNFPAHVATQAIFHHLSPQEYETLCSKIGTEYLCYDHYYAPVDSHVMVMHVKSSSNIAHWMPPDAAMSDDDHDDPHTELGDAASDTSVQATSSPAPGSGGTQTTRLAPSPSPPSTDDDDAPIGDAPTGNAPAEPLSKKQKTALRHARNIDALHSEAPCMRPARSKESPLVVLNTQTTTSTRAEMDLLISEWATQRDVLLKRKVTHKDQLTRVCRCQDKRCVIINAGPSTKDGTRLWRVTSLQVIRRCIDYPAPKSGQASHNFKQEQLVRSLGHLPDARLSNFISVNNYLAKHVIQGSLSKTVVSRMQDKAREFRLGGDPQEILARAFQMKLQMEMHGFVVAIDTCSAGEMRSILVDVAR